MLSLAQMMNPDRGYELPPGMLRARKDTTSIAFMARTSPVSEQSGLQASKYPMSEFETGSLYSKPASQTSSTTPTQVNASATMPTIGTPKHQGRVLIGWCKDMGHAVKGFLDAGGALRLRKETDGINGNRIADCPLPSGRYDAWIALAKVELLPEFKDLRPAEVKEVVRLRTGVRVETDDQRRKHNRAAAQAVISSRPLTH